MTLKQIATFDVKRILFWDIGRAFTTPIRHPLLKAACGWLFGVTAFGLGSILIGITPSDVAINCVGIAFGAVCAISPDLRALRPRLP